MSEPSRLDKLRELVERSPRDPRARYFLANELFRAGEWSGAAEQLEAYLALEAGDVGAALKSLGLCLERLGRVEAARGAYERGIEAALRHHHDGLAAEIRFLLEALDD
ncbi:MAG TPA: tetratricopeptide repeat protein [Candidatus Polarisedimenticolaceae bacterium]|nr:tetratricopeptide repeat protein [Candidatus Polarisedimenticolaceae bacterium]